MPVSMFFQKYDFRVQYMNVVIRAMIDTGVMDAFFSTFDPPKI